jgi:hypothetical protein
MSADLIPVAHPELPAGATVRMRPRVTAGADDRTNGIQVSGRTPSPFGGPMGDHTVAWQALVDAVRAQLHGLPVADAVVALLIAHGAASAWMDQPGSLGRLLLRQLGADATQRRPRLEDASFRVSDHAGLASAAARDGDPAKALGELGRAVAYHLAYLNYLPFATVQAATARGSHGSGEGAYRKLLTDYERGSQPDATAQVLPPGDQGRTALTGALWALFDFRAAIRASHIRYVLDDSIATSTTADAAALEAGLADLVTISERLSDSSTGTLTGQDAGQLTRIQAAGEFIRVRNSVRYLDISAAGGKVRDDAAAILEARGAGTVPSRKAWLNPGTKTGRDRAATTQLYVNSAASQAAEIAEAAAAAPARAAAVLASLLHKHQRTVATAYPRSVRMSEFLGATPSVTAWAVLQQALAADQELAALPVSQERAVRLTALRQAFTTTYQALSPIEIAASNSWAAAAGKEALVVVYTQVPAGQAKFTVDGRADAPTGVEGQGSHTTAWVLETAAMNALVDAAASPAEACEALKAALTEDLARKVGVLTLDHYLPADQLQAGQLPDVFSAAAACLAAAAVQDPSLAAASFLRYRNLLPFATVDAGDRGGHGEDINAAAATLFDRGSLEHATDLLQDAIRDDTTRFDAAAALKTAADVLKAEIDRTVAVDGSDPWPDLVKKAARLSRGRLNKRSAALSADELGVPAAAAADAAAAATMIQRNRWQEHQRTYQELHPGYQSAQYPAGT